MLISLSVDDETRKERRRQEQEILHKATLAGSWLMAESARTTIALIFNMRGGRFGGLLFSYATAAALPGPFPVSADMDVSEGPFSTLSINTLRCRPFSRGSST